MASADDLSVVEEALARLAILEDVGTGDRTAALLPEAHRSRGIVRAREGGVLSGVGVSIQVFRAIDPAIEVVTPITPGSRFATGETLLWSEGRTRSLSSAERTVLNFLRHLSGVATMTARFVEAVEAGRSGVRITDTRKTTPGLRLLEKEAVLHGGGVNHRLGLYDAVMIKDSHVDAAGGITRAVEAARAATPGVPIIVEARSAGEAGEAAGLGVGRILLDNMTPEEVRRSIETVREIASRLPPVPGEGADWRWLPGTWRPGDSPVQVEVSGGITLENAAAYAIPGVDFLAIGRLTHSAPAIDLSMDLEPIG